MKTIRLFLAIIIVAIVSGNLAAQTTTAGSGKQKTETLKVLGKCGMCKSRIEKTVLTEGATSASWDSKSLILTVTFDTSKTSIDAIGKKLASVGHDTEKYKASDDVYEKLPGCCHYDRVK